MEFRKGTIARSNKTNEKYTLQHDVEALQEDKKGFVFRIQDSRGDYIFLGDQMEEKERRINRLEQDIRNVEKATRFSLKVRKERIAELNRQIVIQKKEL